MNSFKRVFVSTALAYSLFSSCPSRPLRTSLPQTKFDRVSDVRPDHHHESESDQQHHYCMGKWYANERLDSARQFATEHELDPVPLNRLLDSLPETLFQARAVISEAYASNPLFRGAIMNSAFAARFAASVQNFDRLLGHDNIRNYGLFSGFFSHRFDLASIDLFDRLVDKSDHNQDTLRLFFAFARNPSFTMDATICEKIIYIAQRIRDHAQDSDRAVTLLCELVGNPSADFRNYLSSVPSFNTITPANMTDEFVDLVMAYSDRSRFVNISFRPFQGLGGLDGSLYVAWHTLSLNLNDPGTSISALSDSSFIDSLFRSQHNPFGDDLASFESSVTRAYSDHLLSEDQKKFLTLTFGIRHFARFSAYALRAVYDNFSRSNPSDARSLLLIATGEVDPNYAGYGAGQMVDVVMPHYRAAITESGSIEAFIDHVRAVAQRAIDHKIPLMFLSTHGDRHSLILGDREFRVINENNYRQLSEVAQYFSPESRIILFGCESGGGEQSIGQLISTVLPGRVYTSPINLSIPMPQYTCEGRFSSMLYVDAMAYVSGSAAGFVRAPRVFVSGLEQNP